MPELDCLKHLRELKADYNAIADLGGILELDGLVKLSMVGNKVDKLDLGVAKWYDSYGLFLSYSP
jgi:Leucine-rich repeat (LRR) protein